jgi:hypothetical protein
VKPWDGRRSGHRVGRRIGEQEGGTGMAIFSIQD